MEADAGRRAHRRLHACSLSAAGDQGQLLAHRTTDRQRPPLPHTQGLGFVAVTGSRWLPHCPQRAGVTGWLACRGLDSLMASG